MSLEIGQALLSSQVRAISALTVNPMMLLKSL